MGGVARVARHAIRRRRESKGVLFHPRFRIVQVLMHSALTSASQEGLVNAQDNASLPVSSNGTESATLVEDTVVFNRENRNPPGYDGSLASLCYLLHRCYLAMLTFRATATLDVQGPSSTSVTHGPIAAESVSLHDILNNTRAQQATETGSMRGKVKVIPNRSSWCCHQNPH